MSAQVTFCKKVAASDMPLVAAPWGGRGPRENLRSKVSWGEGAAAE